MTYKGVIAMIALPLLAQLGFSDACGSEVVQVLLMAPGAVAALYGRFRVGGVNMFGKRV
jgi:hypothetical protein